MILVLGTTAELRSLEDPAIAATLAKPNNRRGRKVTDDVAKLLLTVTYESKDEAKCIGAKWDATQKKWWIKVSDKPALEKARKLGFVKLEAD